MHDAIDRLAWEIEEAGQPVAFTGAGLSTASGLPDLRSEDGIWRDHDPDDFTIDAFERDPGDFWRRVIALREDAFPPAVEPNEAHRALARLERAGALGTVITQNPDGLHQAAGSEDVIELHGSFRTAVCQSCANRQSMDALGAGLAEGDLPPTCEDCGGTLKPDTVLFGEQLPQYSLLRAHAVAEKCDVFLVVGSSLTVEPAARLPETAADRGATLVVVNPGGTPLDDEAAYTFHQDVTTVLPELADAVD